MSSSTPKNPNHDPMLPFYLHPSGNPGAIITSLIFDGENYDLWEKAVTRSLRAKTKLGFIDGSLIRHELKKGEEPTVEYHLKTSAWDTCDSMILAWLMNVIEPSLHSTVGRATDVKSMWDDFKERYGVANTLTIYQLKSDLISLKQGDQMSVVSYYSKFKSIWDEMSQYSIGVLCKCEASTKIMEEKENENVFYFLMGLHDKLYGNLRSQILALEPLPTLGKIYAMVVQEEKHVAITTGKDDSA